MSPVYATIQKSNPPINNNNNITEDVANSEIKSIADVITPTSNTPFDNNVYQKNE